VFLVEIGVFAYVRKSDDIRSMVAISRKTVTASNVMRHLTGKGQRANFEERQRSEFSFSSQQNLWPYKLFCHGSFFGDVEIHMRTPRRCTARCECPGVLLVLDIETITKFMKEFPHFSLAWRSEAVRNERRHDEALKREPMGTRARELAATIIQRYARSKWGGIHRAEVDSLGSDDGSASLLPGSTSRLAPESHALGSAACQAATAIVAAAGSDGSSRIAVDMVRTVGEELRAEMRASLASLRGELLRELRCEVRRGLEAQSTRDSLHSATAQVVGPGMAMRLPVTGGLQELEF